MVDVSEIEAGKSCDFFQIAAIAISQHILFVLHIYKLSINAFLPTLVTIGSINVLRCMLNEHMYRPPVGLWVVNGGSQSQTGVCL